MFVIARPWVGRIAPNSGVWYWWVWLVVCGLYITPVAKYPLLSQACRDWPEARVEAA